MASWQSFTGRSGVIVKVIAFLALVFLVALIGYVVGKKEGLMGPETGGVSSAAPTPKTIEHHTNVPSGASINVQLKTVVGEGTREGDTFVASLTEPLVVDGNMVLPAGTVVEGVVVRAVPLDIYKSTTLSLRLKSVSVDGEKHPVEAGLARVTRDTGSGALIGGVAGGGKGAAIGALIGAAGGTSGSSAKATKGTAVGRAGIALPPGTLLRFELERPLDLKHESNISDH